MGEEYGIMGWIIEWVRMMRGEGEGKRLEETGMEGGDTTSVYSTSS